MGIKKEGREEAEENDKKKEEDKNKATNKETSINLEMGFFIAVSIEIMILLKFGRYAPRQGEPCCFYPENSDIGSSVGG